MSLDIKSLCVADGAGSQINIKKVSTEQQISRGRSCNHSKYVWDIWIWVHICMWLDIKYKSMKCVWKLKYSNISPSFRELYSVIPEKIHQQVLQFAVSSFKICYFSLSLIVINWIFLDFLTIFSVGKIYPVIWTHLCGFVRSNQKVKVFYHKELTFYKHNNWSINRETNLNITNLTISAKSNSTHTSQRQWCQKRI